MSIVVEAKIHFIFHTAGEDRAETEHLCYIEITI